MNSPRWSLVILLGLVAGCSNMADPWPGDWRAPNAQVVRFLPDGKVQIRNDGVVVGKGTYQRLGRNFARVDIEMPGRTTTRMQILKLGDDPQTFRFNRMTYRHKVRR